MRLALATAAVLAVTGLRESCGIGARPTYDPCADRACLDACQLCAPDDAGCFETAELKRCDPDGRCVSSSTSFACPLPDPCAGKACGGTCVIALPCHFANPPCLAPVVVGECDAAGLCIAGGAFSCPLADSCADRTCGVPCRPAGCAAGDPCSAPDACDGSGSCVPPAALACRPPSDPCVGKACGDACDPCGGMCGHPYAMVCDRFGRCVIGAPGTCLP